MIYASIACTTCLFLVTFFIVPSMLVCFTYFICSSFAWWFRWCFPIKSHYRLHVSHIVPLVTLFLHCPPLLHPLQLQPHAPTLLGRLLIPIQLHRFSDTILLIYFITMFYSHSNAIYLFSA